MPSKSIAEAMETLLNREEISLLGIVAPELPLFPQMTAVGRSQRRWRRFYVLFDIHGNQTRVENLRGIEPGRYVQCFAVLARRTGEIAHAIRVAMRKDGKPRVHGFGRMRIHPV